MVFGNMAEATEYIYVLAGVLGALAIGVGRLVVTVSPLQIRHARIWFLASALPLFAVPVTFGMTEPNRVVGLIGAALGAFFLALVYYAANVFLNDRICDADQRTRNSSAKGAADSR